MGDELANHDSAGCCESTTGWVAARRLTAVIVSLAVSMGLPLEQSLSYGSSGYLKPDVDEKVLRRAEDRFKDGVELYQRRSYRAALRRFIAAENACPELFSAAYHVALTHRKMRNEEAAVAQLEKLIARFPENIIAYNDLGVIYAGKNTEKGTLLATSHFQAAVRNGETLLRGKEKEIPQVRVDLAMACANLGAVQFREGRLEEAETSFRKAVEHYPYAFFGHFGLGNTLFAMERFTEAKGAYRKAQQIEPGNAHVHIALAKCYLFERDKNPRFALAELRKIKQEDRSPEYFELSGDAYALLENRDEAIRNYKSSLSRPARDAEVLYKLGAVYYNNAEFEQARKYLTDFIAEVPEGEQGSTATAHKLLGDISQRQKDYEKALAEYDRATQLRDDYLSASYGLGECYFHLKQYDEARKHLRLVLERLPEEGTTEENQLREKATLLLEKMLLAK